MAILEIRTYPDPILTQKAKPVEDVNDSIQQLLVEIRGRFLIDPDGVIQGYEVLTPPVCIS